MPRPKSLTTAYVPAGLLRGVGTRVDRRRQRMTPAVNVDFWNWRNTPMLSSPLARSTPWSTTTPARQSGNTTQYTASYLSSKQTTHSTTIFTNINSLTSTIDMKKQSKETRKSTTDTGVVEGAATGSNDINNTSSPNSIVTTSSRKSRPPLSHSHSTTSDYLMNSSANSSHPYTTTCVVAATSSDQQSTQVDDVSRQNDVTSAFRDSLSRTTYVAALTSQHETSSRTRNDDINRVDFVVKAQVAEAENAGAQANSDRQVMTASISRGEMMTLSGDANMLRRSSSDTQVQHRRTTVPVWVTSDTGEMKSDEDDHQGGSSNETTAGLNDVSQVMSNTVETSRSISSDLMLAATATTSQSATDIDEHSTIDECVSERRMNRPTRGNASTSFTVKTSLSPNSSAVAVTRTLSPNGRGRWVTSPEREQGAFTSAKTEAPTLANSSIDDTYSLWPRPVLLKSTNSTNSDSTVYWSSQSTLSRTVTLLLMECFIIIPGPYPAPVKGEGHEVKVKW